MLPDQYDFIKLERNERVLTATLNRPEAKNAINEALRQDLRHFLDSVSDDPGVGAIVLTGAGDAFCAGGDLTMMQRFIDMDWRQQARNLENGINTLRQLLSVHQPMIAAVNGPATGLGATIALSCDMVVIAESAFLADTHVNAGIVAGDGGALLWPAVLGPNRAKQFLLTGDRVGAVEAERLGLANFITPREEVVKRAGEIALRLANGARFAIEWTKLAVNAQLLRELYAQMPFSITAEARTFDQPDLKEALSAFASRTPPRFPSSHPEEGT